MNFFDNKLDNYSKTETMISDIYALKEETTIDNLLLTKAPLSSSKDIFSDSNAERIITAEIIDLNYKQATLLLNDGVTLKAFIDDSSSLFIGQRASFKVNMVSDNSQGEKIYLKLIPGKNISEDNLINQVLTNAGISKTPLSTQVVSSLFSLEMPLSKTEIQKYMKLSIMNDYASVDTLITFSKNNIPLDKDLIIAYENYKSGEHTLIKETTNFINEINSLFETSDENLSFIKELKYTISNILSASGSDSLYEALLIKPEELFRENGVSDYYKRLANNIRALNDVFTKYDIKKDWSKKDIFKYDEDNIDEKIDKKESLERTFKSNTENNNDLNKLVSESLKHAQTINQELKLFNEINSIFPYLQMPLKFSETNAHGEMYVYSKKAELKDHPDDISVLLHLELDNLGTTDIKLHLKKLYLEANFYLENMSDVQMVNENLPELTKKLNAKGYTISSSVSLLENKNVTLCDFLRNNNSKEAKRYNFDIRA